MKVTNDQGDDYTTGYFIDYPYFEKLKKISINLDKQREIRVDSKVIRHFNLTGNLGQAGSSTMFLWLKKEKKPFQTIHKELWEYCKFVWL